MFALFSFANNLPSERKQDTDALKHYTNSFHLSFCSYSSVNEGLNFRNAQHTEASFKGQF